MVPVASWHWVPVRDNIRVIRLQFVVQVIGRRMAGWLEAQKEPGHARRKRPDRSAFAATTVFSRTPRFRKVSMTAVDDVSLSLSPGRVTALVGQSGSGKSTIAKMITGIERPTSGSIQFGELRVDQLRGRALKDYQRNIQMVFQDPFSSLNPALSVAYILGRPLWNYRGLTSKAQRTRIL